MFTLLSLVSMVGEGKKSVQYKETGLRGVSIWGYNLDSLPFAVISLPDVHFETSVSSENHTHLPVQRHWHHDLVDSFASDYLGSRETEDCASPGDRVHVHQPRAPEIADNASSFQRHFEDDFSPTPSWLDEIVATQPGKAPHLELQPIQIASTPITIGIVVDDPTTQPAPGPTAGEGK